jgi:hypothetical protein
MKRMRAREAASQIAAASLASFLPLAPSRRYGQPRAPGHEVLSRQRAAREHALGRVHRMQLDHALGKIDPYTHGPFSDNLVHGLPPSQAAD